MSERTIWPNWWGANITALGSKSKAESYYPYHHIKRPLLYERLVPLG